MSYDMYRGIFWCGVVGAVVFGWTAAVLFFLFRIPETVGILSGRTAGKAIEKIRRQQAGEEKPGGQVKSRFLAEPMLLPEVELQRGTVLQPEVERMQGAVLLPNEDRSDETIMLPRTDETVLLSEMTEPTRV